MKRRIPYALIQAMAVLLPVSGLAQSLPQGFTLQGGNAAIENSTGQHLQINQTTPRAVLGWSSFNIAEGARVHFNHANNQGMTLNIVDGTSASLISGSLTADDSVYLINPHGLTITPKGTVDTGGAFVASTLSVSAADFMNGSRPLSFSGHGGVVSNQGTINATDVLLLGSRVSNSGTVLAPTGRVALGSASHATLDFNGGGFLQVLAPANVNGSDALVSNSGEIVAAGGLVQLKAATAQSALREAVHMPGVVRAQSVSGSNGAIIFHGGDGGVVNVNGGAVDTTPVTAGLSGGEVEITAAVVRGGVEGFTVGPRGHLYMTVDSLRVNVNPSVSLPDFQTEIVENVLDAGIKNLLTAGTDITLQSRDTISWASGLMIGSSELQAGANDKAGDLTLFADASISMGGVFSTYNGNWTLSAGHNISAYAHPNWATFVNDNGHLRLELRNEGRDADGIQLPLSYAGSGLTATIDPGIPNYDYVAIHVLDNVDVAGTLSLSGHLRATPQYGMSTLRGAEVNWTTETTGGRLAGSMMQFIENGVITRFGQGGGGPMAPDVDAVRLELGSSGTVSRHYGDAELDQSAIGDHLLSVAAHNAVNRTGAISFGDILAAGSIAVSGPGVQAGVSDQQTLYLKATDNIAFNQGGGGPVPTAMGLPVAGGQMASGAYAGSTSSGSMERAAYWIDLGTDNSHGASVNLEITQRPLTADFFDPSYVYGSPQAALQLVGIINDDDVRPVGILDGSSYHFQELSGGYGADERLNVGSYTYGISGLSGAGAGNYSLDVDSLGQGTLQISPKVINYSISNVSTEYSEAFNVWSYLPGLLADDDVRGMVELRNDAGIVDPDTRLGAGEYRMQFFGLTGSDANNYQLATDGNDEGILRVTPKPLTWRVDNVSTVYGTLPNLGIANLVGLLAGDDVLAEVVSMSPLAFNSPVGNYALRVDALTGSDAGNYEIASVGHQQGTLRINPKPLTWQTLDGRSEYGTLPSLDVLELTGALPGDDVSGVVVLHNAVGAAVPVDERTPAGSYTVGVQSLQGEDAGNYQLAAGGNQQGTYQIERKLLSWTVADGNVTYGSTTPPNARTLHGVLEGDAVRGELRLFIDGEVIPPHGPHLPVGAYEVRVNALMGASASNYALADSGNTSGTLNINPLHLNWSLGDATIVYGNQLRIADTTLYGLLPGDDVRPVISADSGSDFSTQPGAGRWLAYVTDLTGRDAGNYVLSDPRSGNNSPGLLTITRRPVSYRVRASQFVYGDDFKLSFNVTNLVEGDEVPPIQYVLMQGDRSVGTSISDQWFVARGVNALGVGTYTIQPQFLVSGPQSQNYTLIQDPFTQLPGIAGGVNITPRPLSYSIGLNAARLDDGPSYANNYQANYLDYAPSGAGRGLNTFVTLEGRIPGDDVSLDIIEPALRVSNQGYYEAGLHIWQGNRLSGSDAANYSVSLGDSRIALLNINPAPVVIRGSTEDFVYGDTERASVDVAVDLSRSSAALREAFDKNYVALRPEAAGFQIADSNGFVRTLPSNLAAGRYEVSYDSGLSLLAGPDVANFVPVFEGERFWVNPRELSVSTTDIDIVYGDDLKLEDMFTLSGMVPGDEVTFDNERGLVISQRGSDARPYWQSGRLLAANEYVFTVNTSTLTGSEASNYMLSDASAGLQVNRRQLYVDVDETLYYGNFDLNPVLRGMLDSHAWYFDQAGAVHFSLTDESGEEVRFINQPDAGEYSLGVQITPLSTLASLLENYSIPADYRVTILPRPLNVATAEHSWTYGAQHLSPFQFDYDAGRFEEGVGILPGDDVSAVFGVYGRDEVSGREIEKTFDEYLRVGQYDLFLKGLEGSKAGNYVLTNRLSRITPALGDPEEAFDYYAVNHVDIIPKQIEFTDIAPRIDTIYGDAIRLAHLGGVLPGDEVNVTARRDGSNITAVVTENSSVLDTTAPSVGEHGYTLNGLTGADSRNYELVASAQTEVSIDQREVAYAIDNVIGQYGNYAGCEDPTDSWLCTYRVDADGVGHPDIWAPLELGQVHLFNWIEGDDLGAGVVLVDPGDGSILTLDDRPTPGTYFQVASGLTGRDAGNYRIAQTGSVPGVLTMTPKWVEWTTYSGFFSHDTGIVTPLSETSAAPADPARASLSSSDITRRVDPAHISGLTPIVKLYRNGDPNLEWDIDPTNVHHWANSPRGVYTPVVVGLEGEYADYYRPLPPQLLRQGRLGFFNVTSLHNYDVEVNSAILETRDQQHIDARNKRWPDPADSLPPDPGPAPSAAQPSESSGSNNGVTVTPDGYVDVLADFGVTGVTFQAGTGSEVNIDYQFGPGYVNVGAQVDATGRLQFSYMGIEGTGSVAAGVSAETGVDGDLDGWGQGTANVGAQAGAFATGSFSYGYEDGRFVYRTETMAGASASATAATGLSGHYGSANVSTTVYSPGTVGAGFSAGGGFSDGRLEFDLQFSLAIGLFGGSVNLSGAVDLLAALDGMASAVEFVGRLGKEIVCAMPFASCRSPSPEQTYAANLETGRNVLRRAYYDLRSYPLQRYALLKASGQWTWSDLNNENATEEERMMYADNRAFERQVTALLNELDQFHELQTQLNETFVAALEAGDARTAVQAMTEMTVYNNLDNLLTSLNERGNNIGVGFMVVNGQVEIVEASLVRGY